MDFEVAVAVASQASQSSMPAVDFSSLRHWNGSFVAQPGVDVRFSADSTSNSTVTKDFEASPFSIFGVSMPSNPQPSGSDLIDSDDDFGDFESVPAEDIRGKPSNVQLSAVEVTNSSSQLRESYDMFDFDFRQVSANAQSRTTHGSAAPDDLFAHLTSSSTDPSIADASRAINGKMSESNSDDDWGDFVEQSYSASQDVFQSFDWFSATPRPVGVTLPTTVVATRTKGPISALVHGKYPNANGEPGDLLFEHFSGFSNVAEAAGPRVDIEIGKAQAAQILQVESSDFSVDGNDDLGKTKNLIVEGSKVSNLDFSGKSPAQDLSSFSTDAFTVHSHESALQTTPSGEIMTNGQKTSAIRNTSTPIPLSLFGEEELVNEPSRGEILDINTTPFQRHSSSKASSSTSSRSVTENFSDFIASLYSQSQSESPAKDAHTWNKAPLNTSHAIQNSKVSTILGEVDESGRLNHESSIAFQYSNGNENSCLEEQLFDLKLNLETQKRLKHDGLSDGIGHKFNETTTTANENLAHFDVGTPQSDHETIGETQGELSDVDTEPVRNVDYDKLLMLLIGEGRKREALICRAHASSLDQLSALQEAYTSAVKALEPEKAASIEREIEEVKLKFASVKEILQWQKRSNHMVSKSLSAGSDLNEVDVHDILPVKTTSSEASLCVTMEDMLQKLGKSCLDRRAVVFEEEFQLDKLLSLAKSDVAAAMDLHSQAVAKFWVLACASVEDQHLFVKAWATVLMVCASELEHALNVWKQAQHADIHLALLADVEGERYFAAIGQIYAVSLVLAAASTLYSPWLSVAVNEGKNVKASLQLCKAAWVGTGLKEAVQLALCRSGKLLQNEALSWNDIEGFATIAHGAALQAANFDFTPRAAQNICGFCLLPLLSFSCLPSVEWAGRHYLLPLANIWANCVSNEAPKLPLIELGNIVIP